MKNQIKYFQTLFYDLMNDYGRVFIIVKNSDKTVIGSRGFTDEEKERGLALVFNAKNHKNIQWTDEGSIVATLGFGQNNKLENCFLHADDIVAVYSPDAMVKYERWDILDLKNQGEDADKKQRRRTQLPADKKVVSLNDFRKIKT